MNIESTCREFGLWLMRTTIPLARSVVGLPLAGATFATGWALQFAVSPAGKSGAARAGEHPCECDEAIAELLG